MRMFIATTKALSDPNRVRILMALARSELCACQIAELLNLAASTVTKHLSILSDAGLVVLRKDGRWHYYSLEDSGNAMLAASAIGLMRGALIGSPQVQEDAGQVELILRRKKEGCCGQSKQPD